ncbi:MAG: hypothetical protein ABL936_04685 [Aestuariivirga sp.]
MATFGDWTYSVDRNATIEAYRAVNHGGSMDCECTGCRNFLLARTKVFPTSFLALLDQLGIDPVKDGEVYHTARLSPGRHLYGGWFHFVGTLDMDGDFPPVYLEECFSVWLSHASAPRLVTLENLPAVQLEFSAEAVPWLLSEPEPT